MNNILPISNIINVTVTTTPQGLTAKNVNSLALFTQDAPINNEAFGIYISSSQVAANYGTDSKTAQMANAVFSQLPNILSGNGRLVIIPLLSSVSATAGNVQTADLSANLAAIIAVTNGDLNIPIDGVATNLRGLNFTTATTWADVATILQARVTDGTITALSNGVEVVSHKVGTDSTVTLGAVSGGSGTDLSAAGFFHAGTAVSTNGSASSGETLLQAIARTSAIVGYVPLMSTLDLEDSVIEATSNGVQALDNMYLQHCASTQDIGGIGTTIQQLGNTRTRILVYTPGLDQANLMKASYAGRAFSTNFTGSDTSTTMNLKQLATIAPDGGITETLFEAAELAGTDLYVSFAGLPSVVSTGGNDFFDNPYADLALKFALETAGFNYLRQTNTKVPQTEPGMTGLKNAYAQVMQQFVRCGELAPGTWDSSETFGDPVIFTNNISVNGYYIYSLPIAQQNSADRDARKAPLAQIAAKRAGAIQSGDVIVLVNS